MPCRQAARMIESPGSKGMVLPSSLKVPMALVVALPADHVQRAECRHDVAQHATLEDLRQAAGDLKARGPDPNAVRCAAAVGNKVIAQFAIPTFRVGID